VFQKLIDTRYRRGNAAFRILRTWHLRRAIKRQDLKYIVRHLDLDGIEFDLMLSATGRGLTRDLFDNDWREYISTRYFLENCLGTGEVVMDVGSNIGYFALMEAAYSPDNVVYAIEPVRPNYDLLKTNVFINRFENIQTFNMAIGDKVGTEQILVAPAGNLSTVNKGAADRLMKKFESSYWQETEILTLGEFKSRHMDKNPTMLRMDVEGFEYEIVTGNREFLEEHDMKLFIEMHLGIMGNEKAVALVRTLKECGYTHVTFADNLEYCRHELVFKPTRGRGFIKHYSIDELILETERLFSGDLRQNYAYELFCAKAPLSSSHGGQNEAE